MAVVDVGAQFVVGQHALAAQAEGGVSGLWVTDVSGSCGARACGSLMASCPGIDGEGIPQDVAFLPPRLEGVGHIISLEVVQMALCPRYWGEGVPLGAWVRVPGLLCRLVCWLRLMPYNMKSSGSTSLASQPINRLLRSITLRIGWRGSGRCRSAIRRWPACTCGASGRGCFGFVGD